MKARLRGWGSTNLRHRDARAMSTVDVVQPTSIVLADDNLLVRAGLQMLLEAEPDFEVVGVAASYDELLESVEASRPQAVVSDIRMPPTHSDEGIRAAKVLRAAHPDVGVVVLSQFIEAAYAISLMDEGSSGRAYVLKDHVTEPEYLFSAIRAVSAKGSYVDPMVVDALVSRGRTHRPQALDRLTPRELDILAAVAGGKSNAGIAASAYIGERAVEKHINSIFAKLGLTEDGGTNRRVKAVLLFLAHDPD